MQETVSSTSQKKHTVASFFAGVGGIELGFKLTGEFSTVYANEFDKNAQITYGMNFEDVPLDTRDIKEVKSEEVPDVKVITGGFPCQAFSVAGYRKGFDDERGILFFDLLRIIQDKQPRVIFIENVKNMVGHDHGNTFKVIREALVVNGYHISWKVLNGSEYGNISQNRERIYIVGFRNKSDFDKFEFPEPVERTNTIHDIIDFEHEKDEVFYYREGKQPFYEELEKEVISDQTVYQWRRKYVRENKSGVVPTLTANMGTGGHNVPIIYTKSGIRKLTPRETFNAQGYPTDYKLPEIANSHLYKQAGNSVVVPVIQRISENISIAIEEEDSRNINLPGENSKFGILKLDILGRYAGKSYIEEYLDTEEEVEEYLRNNGTINRLYITDDEYLKMINKGNSGHFYMVVKV